jgi:DNA-binding XRE family transcriptional regulator
VTTSLKDRRVKAGITRKTAADACGISQFRLDKIERNADGITDEDRQAYADGLAKLLKLAAEHAKTQQAAKKQAAVAKPSTNGAAKKTTPRPRTSTRKAAQPKESAA